jgi:hypothetical protein
MVEPIKCDHCGAEARRVVTKEFDGKIMNFCCRGCLGVFEMLREEGLLNPPPAGKNPLDKGNSKPPV